MKLSKLTLKLIRPVPECLQPLVAAIQESRGVTLALNINVKGKGE